MAFDGIPQRTITLLRVADMLRRQSFNDVEFDMSAPDGFCGTAACIAGHCLLIERETVTPDDVRRELLEADGPLQALYHVTDERGKHQFLDPRANNPALAVQAITNYLAGAALPWKGVLF